MTKVLTKITAAAALAAALGIPGMLPAAKAAGAAQMMAPVLAKMEQAGRDLKTLQAGIAQHKVDRTLGVVEDSAGTVLYKAAPQGAERVLLQYTEPFPETVSVVGDKVSIYQPKLNQLFVTSRRAGANKNRSIGFLGLAYSDAAKQLRDRYDITILGDDPVNGKPATQIALKPKDPADGVQGLLLWIDQTTWLPVKYYIQEKGAKTTITLSGLKKDVDLPDKRFEISVPAGAQVIKG